MHPHPLSNPLTFLFLLQCIHHWLVASTRYNYCKCFKKKQYKGVHCSIWRSCIAYTLVVKNTCYNIVSTWQASLHELQVNIAFHSHSKVVKRICLFAYCVPTWNVFFFFLLLPWLTMFKIFDNMRLNTICGHGTRWMVKLHWMNTLLI